MSTVVVKESHSLSPEEAKGRLAAFEEEISSKFGLKTKWAGLRADLKGTGVSGDVNVTDADVTITVKLGLMARAVVKPDKLKASIEKRLKAALT